MNNVRSMTTPAASGALEGAPPNSKINDQIEALRMKGMRTAYLNQRVGRSYVLDSYYFAS
jgi:hypothetical protein